MTKFAIILTLVGSVLGCGFFSGKEIAVFFSRFGLWSYFAIVFAFVFFFFIFKFILSSNLSTSKVGYSKFFITLNLSICLVFSSAMFACVQEIEENKIETFILIIVAIILCLTILKKGFSVFNKINLFLVPIMTILFLIILALNATFAMPTFSKSLPLPSIFYSLLYCGLNSANSAVVVSSLGQLLDKKDKTRVAFISALVLALILMIANFILLQNQDSLSSSMPFLTLLVSWQKVVLKIVILMGALTTLFCLTYNFYITLKGKSFIFRCIFAIFIPLAISFCGYGFIVCYLEPIASILSIVLLLQFAYSSAKSVKR